MKSRIIEDKIVPGYTVIHCETFKFDFNKLKEFILIYSPDLLHCGDYFWNEDAFKPLSLMGHNWDYLNTREADFSTSFKATKDFIAVRNKVYKEYFDSEFSIKNKLSDILSLAYRIKRNGYRVQYVNPMILGNEYDAVSRTSPTRNQLKEFVKNNYSRNNYVLFSLLYFFLR